MIINRVFILMFILLPLTIHSMDESNITWVHKIETCATDVDTYYEALLANGDIISATQYHSNEIKCERFPAESFHGPSWPQPAPTHYYFILKKIFEKSK